MVREARGDDPPSVAPRWLCRSDDDTVFAYARGHDFIRRSDDTLWAHLSEGSLISARSGNCLAYQVGSVFHDAVTHVPVYYKPSERLHCE